MGIPGVIMEIQGTDQRCDDRVAGTDLVNDSRPTRFDHGTRIPNDLPPLVGVPRAAIVSNKCHGGDNVAHGTLVSSINDFQCTSSSRRGQAKKFNAPPDLDTPRINENRRNSHASSGGITSPSPPVTPWTLSELHSPTTATRRSRLRATLSLDGSPPITRRKNNDHMAYLTGQSPAASPRVVRSATPNRVSSELSKQKVRSRAVLTRSRSMSSMETKNSFDSSPLELVSELLRPAECVKSSSDQSEDSSPESRNLSRTMSGLQIVAEENTLVEDRVSPQSRLAFSNGKQNIKEIVGVDSASNQNKFYQQFRRHTPRDNSRLKEDQREVPDYQKEPIAKETRIAQWLHGLESTEPNKQQERKLSENTLPEIVKRY